MPNYTRYEQTFQSAALKRGLRVSTLGTVFGNRILLATNTFKSWFSGVLIFSGFHGEEYAAPLGILHFLEQQESQKLLDGINIAIVPIVNPDGFNRDKRYDLTQEQPNEVITPSREGRILLDNKEWLRPYMTCFMDMHEDSDAHGFYIYAHTHDGVIRPWHRRLLSVGGNRFGVKLNGLADAEDPRTTISNGVVLDCHDSTFDKFISDIGVPFVAVTETPITSPLKQRILCNSELLQETLRYMGNNDMIIEKHPDNPSEAAGMLAIGYWHNDHHVNLPKPEDFINNNWNELERRATVKYLKHGNPILFWRGWSECKICGANNGSTCLSDGVYVWPEGFAHYIEEHGIKPPNKFLEHVFSMILSNGIPVPGFTE